MDSLITLRISSDLQAQMKKYKVNWSDKIRSYLEGQVRQMELLQFLHRNRARIRHSNVHSDSARMIRADRESR